MKPIDISIVVPIYRCEDSLRKCLDSLVSQDGPASIEILLVNDGSPDNEQEIIDLYAENYPEVVRSFKKENGGLADARNFGVQRARGSYIGFVDSDDYVEPDMFSALFESANRNRAQVAIGRYWHHALDGTVKLQCDLGWNEDQVYHGSEFLLTQRSMVVWNKIYSRDLILDRPQPKRWFEDVAWTPEVMTNASRAVFIDRGFYHYIRREGSIASSHYDSRTLEGIGSVDLAVRNCNPEFRDHVQYMAIRRMLFEATVRPPYADKYIEKAQQLLCNSKDNRFVQADDVLQDATLKIRDPQWTPIPKRIYFFPETTHSTDDERLAAAGYSDLELVDLSKQSSEFETLPQHVDLLPPDEAEALTALSYVTRFGGIYLGRGFEVVGPVAPLLIEPAFVAVDSEGIASFHAFGGRAKSPFLLQWYELCLDKLASGVRAALHVALLELIKPLRLRAPGHSIASEVRILSVGESYEGDGSPSVFRKSARDHSTRTSASSAAPGQPSERLSPSNSGAQNLTSDHEQLVLLQERNRALSRKLQKALEETDAIRGSVRWAIGRRFGFLERSRSFSILRGVWRIAKASRDPHVRIKRGYVRLLEGSNIVPNSVLFESYYGRSIGSSPLALFEAWLQRNDYSKFSFTWVYEGSAEPFFPFQLPADVKVSFVRRDSSEYYSALARSEYLFNDVTFFFDFIKRPGQKYINTWHSITVKSLGYDMPGKPLDQKNVVRNFLSADFLVAANPFVADDTFLRAHFLDGIFAGNILKTGHPRSDLTLKADRTSVESEIQSVNSRYLFRSSAPTIVYAPTWRGNDIRQPSDDVRYYARVCAELRTAFPHCNVVFRPHQITFSALEPEVEGLVAPPMIDANRLFSITDLLITDYSSIFYDFLVTKRPVAFLLHDLEQYRAERGLYIDYENLPGPVAFDIDSLVRFVGELIAGDFTPSELYVETAVWSGPWDDGSVSMRTLKNVLDGVDPEFIDARGEGSRRSVAIYPGPLKGGALNFRVFNAARALADRGYEVSVLVDDSRHPKFVYTIERLLESGIRVVGRSPHFTTLLGEEVAVRHEAAFGPTIFFRGLVEQAFQREWRRCFGDVEFDTVVLLDRRSHAFSRLLGCRGRLKILWPEDSHFPAFGKESGDKVAWEALYENWQRVTTIDELLDYFPN